MAQRIGIGLVVALVAVVALRVGATTSQAVSLRDLTVWLPSRATGDVVLAHAGSGTDGQIVARIRAADGPADLVVVPSPRGAIVLNRTSGELGMIDGVTSTISQRTPVAGVDGDARLLWSPAGGRLVTATAVHKLDLESGVPNGSVALASPLRNVVVDDAGVVYGIAGAGQFVAVSNDVRPLALGDAAEPVGLVAAGGRVFVVDRRGPDLVEVNATKQVGRSCLSGALSANSPIVSGGSMEAEDPAAVVVDAGGMRVATLGEKSCFSVALKSTATYAAPVAVGTLVFLPVLADPGRLTDDGVEVIVVDTVEGARVSQYPLGLPSGTPVELLAHDGTVWFNDPSGASAGVLQRDRVQTRLDKTKPLAANAAGRASTDALGPPTNQSGSTGARVSGASGIRVTGPSGTTGAAGTGGVTGVSGASGSRETPTGPRTTAPGSGTTVTVDQQTDTVIGPSSPTPRAGLVANFTFSSRSVRVGQAVQFVDDSTGGPTAWTWDFGDGSFATGPKTSHAWTQAGVYTVQLRIENAVAFALASLAITVLSDTRAAKPEADFRFSASRVEAGQPVTFTDRSTDSPTEWQWSFGDGSGGSGQTITHTYRSAGTYEVVLTVSNDQGSSTSAPAVITVFDKVEPPVALMGGGSNTATVGQLVSWFSRSTGNPTTLQWNFGDGTTASGPVAQHTWNRAGSFVVTLVVSNSSGSSTATASVTVSDAVRAPVSRMSVSQTTAEEGQLIRFQSLSINAPTQLTWDFGDGGSASGPLASRAYARAGTYTVSLRATNAAGSDVATQVITVVAQLPAPVAAFSFSPTRVIANSPVTFADESSGGTPSSWSWDFGDGTPVVNQRNPSHIFDRAGTFVVRLVASNAKGSSQTQRNVTVLPAAPEPAFTFTPLLPTAGTRVEFTDTSGGGAATSWLWNFGDGSTSTQRNPSHIFALNGSYDVRLTVTNASGSPFVVRRVDVNPPAPVASFTFTPDRPTTATPVVFRNTSTGGAPSTVRWDFGDTTPPSSVVNPSHTYAAPGSYVVRLTLGNATGTSTIVSTVVVAAPAPVASFVASTPAVAGAPVMFTNTSTGGPFSAVLWEFGDGSAPSTAANPTHTFATPGAYDVRLTVTNAGGPASTTVRITVVRPTTASFTVSSPRIALQPITFTNTSTAGPFASIEWDFGDGATATGATVAHSYAVGNTYDVTLRVVTTGGATDDQTTTITVAPQVPVAAFTYAPTTPARTVTFSSAPSAGGPFTAIIWDFDDGSPLATGATVTHTFPAGASFDVRLTVTNPTGTNSVVRTVSMATAVASFTRTTGSTPRTINFTSTSTGGPFVAFAWNFGDGTPAGSGASTSHVYAAAGTYVVTLTVTNGAGSFVSVPVSVVVP